jgi:hypothetical protein
VPPVLRRQLVDAVDEEFPLMVAGVAVLPGASS